VKGDLDVWGREDEHFIRMSADKKGTEEISDGLVTDVRPCSWMLRSVGLWYWHIDGCKKRRRTVCTQLSLGNGNFTF